MDPRKSNKCILYISMNFGVSMILEPKKTRGPPGILHPPPALGSYDMGRMKF